ncbi:MAG: NAD(+) kinase [Halobacteriovoraceae bacterium]|nr:NAD(+) kinase [Halobacteriovoraceae bacterium]
MKVKQIVHIGLVFKPSHIEDLPNLTTNLVRWLNRRHKKIYISEKQTSRFKKILSPKTLEKISFIDEKFIYHKADLLISLGGDGTLLGVSRRVSSKVPVFSVNIGRLGFITEFSKADFYERLNIVLLGKFKTFKKNLYSITVAKENGKSRKEYFFNDAVFTKNDLARMFTLSVESDGEHIYHLSGDGLIVSSTYGSTAYSLAAGGPIVHPDVKALILTPICAHSLTHRPLVIPDTQNLEIKLLEDISTVNITLDGQICVHIEHTDIIMLKKEQRRSISLIKNSDKTYFHTLKEKFVHGRREIY